MRIADDRLDVPAPCRDRFIVEIAVVADFVQILVVMIVVPGKQLISSGAADRDSIAVCGDRLHQEPLGVVGDGVDGRIMLKDQLTESAEKIRCINVNGCVADSQLLHCVLDHRLFVVSLVVIDDREAMHIVIEHTFGDTDERVRIDAAAHEECERHISAQTKLHGADQSIPYLRSDVVERQIILVPKDRLPVSFVMNRAGTSKRQRRSRLNLFHAAEEARAGFI